jgi:D-serine deaminase-like pyridoxal phosphate-dependent protein
MRCPVSGKYAGDKVLVHGGAVHFSKDVLELQGRPVYGQVARTQEKGWGKPREAYLTALSQEHGSLEKCGKLWEEVRPGDELLILPVHSCLTANLMGHYQTLEGTLITTIHSP